MTPDNLRRWVARIAAFDGWSVAALGGVCVVLSLLWLSLTGLLIGGAGVASGAMELTGRRRLLDGRPYARAWLAGSQVLLLGAILLYAGYRLATFDPQEFTRQLSPDLLDALKDAFGEDLNQLVARSVRLMYEALIIAALLYQGGLCLFYALATRKLAPSAPSQAGGGSGPR